MAEDREFVSEIIDNLRRVIQVVNEQSKRAVRETGLTGPQLWTIKVVADFSPIKVTDLARRLYLHPATVVGIIDRLEKRGLIARLRSREDRRVVRVELTQKGRDMVDGAPEVVQGLLVAGLEAMNHKDRKSVAHALSGLVKILGAREITPRLMLSPEVNLPEGSNVHKE